MSHEVLVAPPADAGGAIAAIRNEISSMAAGIDGKFVHAGTILMEMLAAVTHVIDELKGITTALDPEHGGNAIRSLLAVANELAGLSSARDARRGEISAIRDTAAQLRGDLSQAHEVFRVLGVYGTNLKIAAGGAAEFVVFVDEMSRRLKVGETEFAGFAATLTSLAENVTDAERAEWLLDSQCRRVLPHVPEKLARDAESLRQHQEGVARMAAKVGAVAAGVQAKVATILGALQIGDTTRQRLEHIVAALQLLNAFGAQQKEGDGRADEGIILRLLSAQLQDTLVEFDVETKRLARTLRDLGPAGAKLVALRQMDEGGAEGGAFLQSLEQGISEADRVTRQLRETNAAIQRIGGAIGDTISDLETRLNTVQAIRGDVEHMAINTGLRAQRMGQAGRAIAVIASEIRTYSARFDEAANGITRAIAELGGVGARLRGLAAEGQRDLGAALTEALGYIRGACDRVEQAVGGIGDDAARIITMLEAAAGDLGRDLAVSDVIADVADWLAALAEASGQNDMPNGATGELLCQIGSFYTMARERAVHQQLGLIGIKFVDPPVEINLDDNDEFDDCLF
jgi:ABC-type transporter Mla subunit MlaD